MIQSHQQLSHYESWSAKLASAVSGAIGAPDTIIANGSLLDVSPSVTDEQIVTAILKLGELEKRSSHQSAIIRYGVGRMILELCSRSGRLETEVIDDEGIAAKLNLSPKAVLNWVQVVKQIPPSMLKPGVSWNCLASAAVRLPEDPIQILAIREAQDKALEEASANPVECTGAVVRKKVHEAMEGMGLKPPAPPDKFQLLLVYCLLLRKLRHVDETGETGVDRIELVNQIEAAEASCVNLEIVPSYV